MMAVKAGYDISPLLKAGADVISKNKSGTTALHLVYEDFYFLHIITTSMSFDHYKERKNNNASQLIAAGADISAQDNDGNTPLMMAVNTGHDISLLLTTGADVNSKNKSGKTALHLVSENVYGFDTTVIQNHPKLIAAGADISAQDNDGNTLLMMAVKAGHDISLLLTTGADVNSKNKSGKTALHFVSEKFYGFDTTVIQNDHPKLIAAGADVSAQDNDGNTPLMMAVKAGSDISPLLTAGTDVKLTNKSGKTALHFVSEGKSSFRSQKKTISVHHLIAAGADVNAQDNVGNTSLHMCIMYNDYHNAMVLLHNPGTDVNYYK
ncbi:putative ankyrin repeat protein RF_0381 [Haliotis rubra]|uniref:putative ankyrin repeat protein RF_0381 n=1 Tax=Haliotis rubra TaxID=36100 RepID=UPI001EE5FC11|nr:putative ankyrin repeat protein RF_0381 [Haliotis rubra]